MIRVGFGYDVHKLIEGRPLMLGGINIPHTKGSLGHSDGDALIHSICDALLGASGLRDIGTNFPDNQQDYKDIDSKILLTKTRALIAKKGYSIVNIDTTICIQVPKINPFVEQIKESLSNCLEIDKELIGVKAKTMEKMGFIGKEKGVSAYAVVLIEKKE
jgi:2-C-methyl-D-erythritol 2,4-cyclodiphosphate synthase